MKEDEFTLILKNQISAGQSALIEDVDVETYKYDEKDLNATIQVLEMELKSNGFKFLSEKEFNEKINTVFNRTIDPFSDKKYLSLNFEDKCDRNIKFYRNDNSIDINPFRSYIIKKESFITELFAIPEIFDYQNSEKEILTFENNLSKKQKTKQGDEIQLYLWKDYTDLREKRQKNIQTLVARNMYLFNNSRAHFKWLILNDENFMEKLVTVFGYTEDKELVDWVLKKLPEYEVYPKKEFLKKLGNLIFIKDCDDKIRIHKNIFELIKEKTTKQEKEYLCYLSDLIVEISHNESVFKNLNINDKAKIIAHILEFGEQYKYDKQYNFNQLFIGRFIYYIDTKKKLKKEIEKNNFYNLPNLKNRFLAAEQEKDIFKDNNELPDDPQPRDYIYRSN